MKQLLRSSLWAVLLLAPLGVAVSSQAEESSSVILAQSAISEGTNMGRSHAGASGHKGSGQPQVISQGQQRVNEEEITKLYAHNIDGTEAVTLYLRNIPVLTFLGGGDDGSPLERARSLAAKIDRLNRDGVDANGIGVQWKDETQEYLVEVNGEPLLVVDAETRLADTTNKVAEDALQVTNRLRRLLGKAPPLAVIANQPEPKPPEPTATNDVKPAEPEVVEPQPDRVRYTQNGWASWYGPGFHGNRSASGEIFNQYAMTAAHRTLPFGTWVRVTNLNNGLTAMVRINDRGPFTGGRIIDLSIGAAEAIGMVSSGVAPVRVEILDP